MSISKHIRNVIQETQTTIARIFLYPSYVRDTAFFVYIWLHTTTDFHDTADEKKRLLSKNSDIQLVLPHHDGFEQVNLK